MDTDDMSLVYNINLCRICQIPDKLDLISTSTVTDDGETYLDLLKFIFNDILWTEDTLISMACNACVKKIIETAAFKNICFESNKRRGQLSLDPIKLEIETTESEVIADYDDKDELEDELEPLQIETAFIKFEEQTPKKSKLTAIVESPKSKSKAQTVARKPRGRPKKETSNEEPVETDGLEVNEPTDRLDRRRSRPGRRLRFCDLCQKQCKSMEDYDRHMHKHTGIRNYICNECGRTYITGDDLKQHAYVHNTEAKFECHICGKKFKTNSNLGTHKTVVHMNKDDYKYLCTQCGQKFPQLSMLKYHIHRLHTRDRNFTCDICGKAFIEKSVFKKHCVTHTNVRPFKCDVCPSEFKRKDVLLNHKTKQHGIGNYKFSDEKKYDCNYCDKKVTKDKLPRHIRSHTGSKPFSCRLCGMKFSCNSYIKGHVQRKHDIDVHSSEYDSKSYYDVSEEPPLADIAAIIKNSPNK